MKILQVNKTNSREISPIYSDENHYSKLFNKNRLKIEGTDKNMADCELAFHSNETVFKVKKALSSKIRLDSVL